MLPKYAIISPLWGIKYFLNMPPPLIILIKKQKYHHVKQETVLGAD